MRDLKLNIKQTIFQFGTLLKLHLYSKLDQLTKSLDRARLTERFRIKNPVLLQKMLSKLDKTQQSLTQITFLWLNPVWKYIKHTNLKFSLEKLAIDLGRIRVSDFYFLPFGLTRPCCGIVFPPFRGEYIHTQDVLGVSKLESLRSHASDTATSPKGKPSQKWTPDLVAEYFEEAVSTSRRLPPVKVRGYYNLWPEIKYTPNELMMQEPRRLRVLPTSDAISRLEQMFEWMLWVTVEERKLLWWRGARVGWKIISRELACDNSTAWRKWKHALAKISIKLNKSGISPRADHDR